MSKYLLDKFLFTVDRDPDLVEKYLAEPADTVVWWEDQLANHNLSCHTLEASTWLRFDNAERRALIEHDYRSLFAMGAHPFLTLTLFIAMYERFYTEPLAFQLEYAQRLSDFELPYPEIET